MVTLRPEDLYIANPNDVIYGYPLFNEHLYPTQIDTVEYCLGLQRGSGSSYRRAGACLLVSERPELATTISSISLRQDVAAIAT